MATPPRIPIEKPVLTRRPDWNARLTVFLAWSYRDLDQLIWDSVNCGSWAAKAVEVQTDYDLYSDFRGHTETAVASYKRLKELGFDTLDDYVRARLPYEMLSFVRKGDLVLVPATGDFCGLGMANALAVADPPHFHALSIYGPGRGALSDAVEAFAIGREGRK